MKKELFSKMSMFQGLSILIPTLNENPEYVMPDSDLDRVLREIFSVDERSGLPMQDIAYVCSKNGNPQVKDWLLNNLMKAGKVQGEKRDAITDDMIAEFGKRADESSEDYAARLCGMYDSAKAEYEKSLENKE